MITRFLSASFLSVVLTLHTVGADWPMYRADAGRTGVTETKLPDNMELKWIRDLPPITPAFHSKRLQFDAGHEPIVVQGKLLIASGTTDSVTAYESASGRESWVFRTNGPVRLAPAVWQDSVCFGSDDGHFYCVDLHTGTLKWKLRAVPSDRRVLGNRRLISTWPVRGGPVIADSRVYFAAGVWPFEGVFVYAVDIASGEVIWRNDRLGYMFGTQPHNTQAIGGLAPQGYLVINGDELIVPCSTAYPARLDRTTGKLIEFELPAPGRFPGGWFAAIDPEKAKAIRRGQLTFDDVINRQQHEDKVHKGLGESGISRKIVAAGQVVEFDKPLDVNVKSEHLRGTVHSIVVADNQLFVSTREGQVACFGATSPTETRSAKHWKNPNLTLTSRPDSCEHARSLISQASSVHGIAVVAGLTNGELVKALLTESEYHVIAVDNDPKVIQSLRSELISAGLYGQRTAVLEADPKTVTLPPYLATLITTESAPRLGVDRHRLLQSVRPHGGVAALDIAKDLVANNPLDAVAASEFAEHAADGNTVLERFGALPGARNYLGEWAASPDELVRFPLGVLWFDDTVAHFKRSPQPKFVDGVMVSQPKDWHAPRNKNDYGVDYPLLPYVLSDIYTGRLFDPTEEAAVRASLSTVDPLKREPSQYRPPHQKNAWKPDQPIAGTRTNPLTGELEPRTFPKTYGCDGGVDYGDFYTVRSGTPAFYDKTLESGTVFLSGPRSGCTNSIIPAGGLLNVPYFYEGCTCSYPLPTAMSLVAMPESHEQWSSWGESTPKPNSIERIGLNFGAPGDRMTRAGTLWLDYPSVGGPSPKVTVSQSPQETVHSYVHSLWLDEGEGHAWVAASVVEGLQQITLHELKPGRYKVRLYFAEPNKNNEAARVQNVSLQDEVVLSDFNVKSEAGGVLRGITKEFNNIVVDGSCKLGLTSVSGQTLISGMELIRSE